MSSKKGADALAKVTNPKTLATLQKAIQNNLNASVSRWSPNADRLQDGAIQRASVEPKGDAVLSSVNTDKVGFS